MRGRRTLGFTQAQLRAEPFIAFVHPDDVELTVRETQRLFDGVDTAEFRNRFRTRDGDWRWLEWTSTADLDDGLIYAAARDVTDRVEAERDLRKAEAIATEARDAAVEASRLKSAFVANMSHEIRTPLNGVLGMTDLLLDSDLDADQREKRADSRRLGRQPAAIIDDILDFSKIEAGKLEIEEVAFDLREAIEDACDLVAERAAAKGLELRVALDPATCPRSRAAIPSGLRQVLMNLLSNAVKFTAEGEVVVSATATAAHAAAGRGALRRLGHRHRHRRGPPRATVRVVHAGRRLDDPALRRHRPRPRDLQAARRADGRKIEATSQPGTGSVFSVTLPFDAPPSLARDRRAPHRRGGTAPRWASSADASSRRPARRLGTPDPRG